MAPEGYKLSTETVTFVVKEDGTVDGKVVMYNSPKKSVLISKKDFTTGEELPGAKLELRNEKGRVNRSLGYQQMNHMLSKDLNL